ncbi:MAG: hypothetical protein OEZ04_10180 [Nitrospinota bacterium]|nr:hypothetical protein [Nitrospinota bacterium]
MAEEKTLGQVISIDEKMVKASLGEASARSGNQVWNLRMILDSTVSTPHSIFIRFPV